MYAAGPRPYPAYTAISTCEISGFYIGISAGNKKHYNSIWRYCPLWLSYSIIVIVIFTSKRVYCNKRGNFLQKRTYSKIFDIQFYNSSGFLDYKKHHRLFIHPVCFCPAAADAVYGLAQYDNLPLLLRLRRVETTGLVCISALWGRNNCSHQFLNWWQRYATGISHFRLFESRSPAKRKTTPNGVVFFLVETTGLEPVTSCV